MSQFCTFHILSQVYIIDQSTCEDFFCKWLNKNAIFRVSWKVMILKVTGFCPEKKKANNYFNLNWAEIKQLITRMNSYFIVQIIGDIWTFFARVRKKNFAHPLLELVLRYAKEKMQSSFRKKEWLPKTTLMARTHCASGWYVKHSGR